MSKICKRCGSEHISETQLWKIISGVVFLATIVGLYYYDAWQTDQQCQRELDRMDVAGDGSAQEAARLRDRREDLRKAYRAGVEDGMARVDPNAGYDRASAAAEADAAARGGTD